MGSVPVTVISQELARALADRFGIKDPIGQIVRLPSLGYDDADKYVDMQVVGVIRGERVQRNLRLPLEPVAYVPLLQAPRREVNLIVRTNTDSSAVLPSIREAIRLTDSRLAVSSVRTMADIRRQRSLTGTAEPARVIGAFAAVAALLAGLGLYGVLAQTVLQQRREIGIRLALGASARTVLAHVLRRAGVMVAIGLAAGLRRSARPDESPGDPALRGVATGSPGAGLGGCGNGPGWARGCGAAGAPSRTSGSSDGFTERGVRRRRPASHWSRRTIRGSTLIARRVGT